MMTSSTTTPRSSQSSIASSSLTAAVYAPLDTAAVSPAVVKASLKHQLREQRQRQQHQRVGAGVVDTSLDVDDGSLSNTPIDAQTPSLDDEPTPIALPVVCSEEMNAYCPANMKCCPQYSRLGGIGGSNLKQSRMLGVATRDATIVGYTCLGSAKGVYPVGECCDDEVGTTKGTGSGCAIGYKCAVPRQTSLQLSPDVNSDNLLTTRPHCQKDEDANPLDIDGDPIDIKYDTLPRYSTCAARKKEDIAQPLGLPVPASAASYLTGEVDDDGDVLKVGGSGDEVDGGYIGQLAYYSNMGSITSVDGVAPRSDVRTAVIGIHGSGRTAANYLCAMIAAVEDYLSGKPGSLEGVVSSVGDGETAKGSISSIRRRQQQYDTTFTAKKEEMLVVAPWFLAPEDGDPSLSSNLPVIKWDNVHPIPHTFRYGGESIGIGIPTANEGDMDQAGNTTISSFGAMDVLLETLCKKERFPNLERIIVAGHSAGGQFVHRWGVSSDSWCLDQTMDNLPKVRLVAANPRSYAYLDGRRYFPTDSNKLSEKDLNDPSFFVRRDDEKKKGDVIFKFRELTSIEQEQCPEFNSYEWGLNYNPKVPAPYVKFNVKKLLGLDDDFRDVFCRYASRDLVYLAGERDTEKLGNQICNEDGYQGPTRRERSSRFYLSLQVIGREEGYCERDDVELEKDQVHTHRVVKDVGHDHALIFQSEEGLEGMFN